MDESTLIFIQENIRTDLLTPILLLNHKCGALWCHLARNSGFAGPSPVSPSAGNTSVTLHTA